MKMLYKVWHWIERGLWLALLFPGLVGASVLSLRLYPRTGRDFVIGARGDDTMLQFGGFYNPERTATGTPYRWSAAASNIGIRSFFALPPTVLSLTLSDMTAATAKARPVQVAVDGATLLTLPTTVAAHRFALVLPANALQDGVVDLGFTSTPAHVAPDPRELGLRLDDLALNWSDTPWRLPSRQTLVVQGALAVLVLATLRRLAVPKVITLIVCSGFVVLLGWLVGREQWMPTNWETTVLVGALVVCVVAWGVPVLLGSRFLSASQ